MKASLAFAFLMALPAATALASDRNCDFTALRKPISALSPPLTAIKGDPRVCATRPPPRHSVWQSIQPALDRSTGRIEDRATWEITRIERSREPRRPFEILMEERERQFRIDEQRRRLDQLDERQQRLELDRREYEMFVRTPLSPAARQAEADRVALEAAKADRDRALIAAQNALTERLRQRGADRDELRRDYDRTRQAIRQQYEAVRSRILGD